MLDGNLFERHQLLRDLRHTRTFCICKHIQTIGGRERKSKPITVSDGQVFEVTERARFPLQTPSDCFVLYFTLADGHWEITIFMLVFLHNVCLDV